MSAVTNRTHLDRLKIAIRFHSLFGFLGCLIPFLGESVSLYSQDPFESTIQPFLQTYCIDCHSGTEPEGKLDLGALQTRQSISDRFTVWKEIERRVAKGNMPPKDAAALPSEKDRQRFTDLIQKTRREEAIRFAGDPGVVSVRRLSNAEYNNTLRDLTGTDIRPAREFPVDPANEAGFDNSGESLTMSPALLNKYLAAARDVSNHMVLTPTGIAFAPHQVVTDTDRDKVCVQRIVDFYNKQPTDIADYLYAAWKARIANHSIRSVSLERLAEEHRLSPRYLSTIVNLLNEADTEPSKLGPLAEVRRRWLALPTEGEKAVRHECESLRDFILEVRRQLEPAFNMRLKGIHDGAQAFVLWKNRQSATHRQSFLPETLKSLVFEKLPSEIAQVLKSPDNADLQTLFHGDLELFCRIFPDSFFVSERGRDYLGVPKDKQEKGRLLSAGFHSMMGYFRDDQPLCELVLDNNERLELNRLWQELDFVTSAPMRQYQGFLWFERTDHKFLRDEEFDFARPENKDALSAELVQKLSDMYLAKAKGMDASTEQLTAIADFFTNIDAQIRWVEQTRVSSEKTHLNAIEQFAERAYRGSLTTSQRNDLREYYTSLRQNDNLSHDEAIQDLLVSVLMSPEFCYRVDLGLQSAAQQPLGELELANRLSYFLWSSMPDERLLAQAHAGRLKDPDIWFGEVDRMLRDDRVRGLAIEFGSQWLDFRRFQEHNSVDRVRFPQFTDSLREAMYQEPIRFLVDLIQQNRSVLSCIDGKHTFVNTELADHYGIARDSNEAKLDWWRVSDLANSQRGGLLPMAVFLTQNAPGLRTSPVKRGYWVVRRLLGEEIPPPPPNVPELPVDESQLGELSLRQTLEKHRQLESCAVCHDRFDSIGLVFESYGPVGERRSRDLGEKLINDSAVFPNGQSGRGVDGLREYIMKDRQSNFIDNLCRKLLAFALGRSLRLSDDILIEKMQIDLASEDYRFGTLIRAIVSSPQFLQKRGTDHNEKSDVE